jgi:hypothetical protein
MKTARPKERGRDIDPTTPFDQIPGNVLLTTARRLGELGLDSALAAAIRQPQSEGVVRQHLAMIRVELSVQATRQAMIHSHRQRPRLIHGRFTPQETQLANVRRWNAERHWGIPEDWFTTLGPAPTWPTDSKLSCVVLEVALPDQPEQKDAEGNVVTPAIPGMIRTVRELWDITSHQHPKAEKLNQFHLDAEHLELLDGVTYEPDLRWRVLDLGANWDRAGGIRPVDVRTPLTSPNVDGFAALAHHPQFVRRMNGTTIPFLWISGFMVSIPGGGPLRCVPLAYFIRDARQVGLLARGDGFRNPSYAVPVRREYKRP